MGNNNKEFLLRLPLNLYERLKSDANKRELSVNSYSKQILMCGAPFPEIFISIQSLLLSLFPEDIVGILIFGSFARGEAFDSSDIDVLLIINSSIPIERDLYEKVDRLKLGGREISVTIVHLPKEVSDVGSLWLEVALDGIVIYDPDIKVSQFLMLVKQYILKGSVQRRISYGVPYWTHTI